MSFVTATSDPDGNSGTVSLLIGDINYMTYDKLTNKIIFHTDSKLYYTMGTLDFWTNLFINSGFKFRIIDRSNSANVDRIIRIDSVKKVAYFNKERTIKCTFSIPKYKVFIKEFPLYRYNGVVIS